MARLGSWIEPSPPGNYVGPAKAWVDPSQPKPQALMHWRMTHQIKARELNLVGYEDEDD
jgi:putative mRNA 3-end processing factor